MDSFVEETLDWAPLTESDLPDLAELRAAVEYFDDPVTRLGLAEFVEAWELPGADPARNTIAGRDRAGGNLVAYGWDHVQPHHETPRVVLTGAVHPAWRDQRIGHALAGWQLIRAKEWASGLPVAPRNVWVGVYSDDGQSGTRRLFANHGLSPERYFFDLHHIFARMPNLPAPQPVEGIVFMPYDDARSDEVRMLHNACFAGVAGFHPVTTEVWARMQGRPEFRPAWSWLALSRGEIVGYALNSADEAAWRDQGFTEGWTDRLGVRPDYRRHGIATGLLSRSMCSFDEAGLEGAGLGIDTEDEEGTLRLYQAIGYESNETVVLLSATLPVAVA